MLFKYALRSFRRYAFQNLLTILQLSAALTMTVFMISAVSLRLNRFEPFEDYFAGDGCLAVYSSWAHSGDLSGDFKPISSSRDMSEYLSAEAETLGAHISDAEVKGSELRLRVVSLDEEVTARYAPPLAAGKWFRGSGVEAAVTEGCGYSVGDTVELEYFHADGSTATLKAAVTSLLKKDARVPGQFGANDGPQANTFELFYSTAEDERNDGFVLLRESDLSGDMFRPYFGTVLISFKNSPTEAQREEYRRLLAESGSSFTLDNDQLMSQSRRYLSERIYELLPLIVILGIMAFVGSISTSALSTRQQLRDSAVFALCGLPFGRSVVIGAIQSLMCLAVSGAVSAAAVATLRQLYPDRLYALPDARVLWGTGAIALMFMAVSLIMPVIILYRSSVRELLRRD